LIISLSEVPSVGILFISSDGGMKDLKFPVHILGSPLQRAMLGRAAGMAFVLFWVIPLLSGLVLPHVLALTDRPSASLLLRVLLLVATGGASFLLAWLPALLVVRVPVLWRAYVFLLFPVAVVSLATQAIMYREFGTEIDEHLFGLFQGNAGALWVFGREKYHLDWVIAGVVVASLLLTRWVCRDTRVRWVTSRGFGAGAAVVLLISGSLALGMRPDLKAAEHYDASKLSSAPLYQVVSFAGNHWLSGGQSGYLGILERAGEVVAASDHEEISRRLGQSPEDFCERTVVRPPWLRKRPSHVFLFLMESMELELLKSPDMKGIAPGLERLAREGLIVTEFHASSGATIDAVHAMSSGAAAVGHYPVPRKLAAMNRIDTLPRLMKRAGYTPLFYAASRRRIASKGDICEAYGYDRFLGCPDVATGIPSNEWGVSDGDFFEWARKETGELKSPHFVTFLNVSNHAPYNAPLSELGDPGFSEATISRFVGKDAEERAKYAGHVKYADLKVAEMARWLKDRYPDALVALVGDHCGNKVRGGDKTRVPFILWNDRVIDPAADASSWFGAHMDIPATLASLVLPEGERFRSLGQPVWSAAAGRVSPAGQILVTATGPIERGAKVPGSFVPGSVPGGKEEIILRGSAIEALSWGYPNGAPLSGQPAAEGR
jgi:Sulfatase